MARRGRHAKGRALRNVVTLAALVVLAGAGAVAVYVSQRQGTSRAPSPSTTASGLPAPQIAATCPLTGTPAPGGSVPERPAMAVKIGNNPSALPQSGLTHADVVFEEPIEGAITRLLAIFQCHEAPRVEPIRSTRWIDAQLLPELGHPGFAFAGGIIPDERLIARSGVFDLNFTRYYSAFARDTSRLAPNNLYTSTARLWAIDRSRTPPAPLFSYSKDPPAGGSPVAGVDLTWSSIYAVAWRWNPATGTWVRYLGSEPEVSASGATIQAANVVVETVRVTSGPYVEDAEGAHGVRSETLGSGPVLILRNGVAEPGTWERSSIDRPARFVAHGGSDIPLAPGSTWVELVPTYGTVKLVP